MCNNSVINLKIPSWGLTLPILGYGTSPVEEQVILSLCPPEEILLPEDTVRTMTVDYVRVWQRLEAEED